MKELIYKYLDAHYKENDYKVILIQNGKEYFEISESNIVIDELKLLFNLSYKDSKTYIRCWKSINNKNLFRLYWKNRSKRRYYEFNFLMIRRVLAYSIFKKEFNPISIDGYGFGYLKILKKVLEEMIENYIKLIIKYNLDNSTLSEPERLKHSSHLKQSLFYLEGIKTKYF